ncbi:MAG: energy-coupling factor ABC transporter ATP-binding protein [Desulfohalobiaceae bacterium]|nr:energy-coupling factor ABC transporter ATP-binding protein [Desulfohalobiaceae bacterium]
MIRAENLTFGYSRKTPVLRDVGFSLEPGGLAVLSGANGSGKSTLLLLLAGLFTPQQGSISVQGRVIPGEEKQVRRRTGLLLQEAELQILGTTVGEDILLGTDPGNPENLRRAEGLASRMGLSPLWDTPVEHLSGGQRRKLCLASVLMGGPRILLYDEPFSGLDYPAVREFRQILRDNAERGVTQVVATHDLEPVLDLAREMLLLDHGELVGQGPPESLLDRAAEHGVRPPCLWQREGSLVEGLW